MDTVPAATRTLSIAAWTAMLVVSDLPDMIIT
jgi:hypothetical protein